MKPLFISGWISSLFLVLLYSLYTLTYTHQWRGVSLFLMALGPLSFLISLYTRQQGRSTRFPALPNLFLSLGALFLFTHQPVLPDLIATFICLGGWLGYLFWYVKLDRPSSSITLQHTLPDFRAPDLEGEIRSSHSFFGKTTLWLFFRGNWCPLCMAQIKEIATHYQALHDAGAEIVFISPQPQHKTQALAEHFDLPFHFLVDEDLKVAQRLKLQHKEGLPAGMQLLGYAEDTVFPTLAITDPQGKVVFLDQTDDYRLRPEPSTFLNLIQKLKET